MIKYIFTEARKNPELNPKISGYEALKKYKNDPDIYVSYTKLKKIGINPRSQYNTPNGIYAYPLKEIWKDIEETKNSQHIPSFGYQPYIHILKYNSKEKFINDMYSNYKSKDYDKDLPKIKEIYENLKNKEKPFKEILEDAKNEADFKNPIGIFWSLTKIISKYNTKFPAQTWNNILRRLGYVGFADKLGKGIIHGAEPLQAVFLTKEAFDVIDMVYNKHYAVENDTYNGNIDIEKVEELVKYKNIKIVNGNFSIPIMKLYYLEGIPEKVTGNFTCSFNKLTSLKGCPKHIGGNFDCRNNEKQFTEEDVRAVSNVKGKIIV